MLVSGAACGIRSAWRTGRLFIFSSVGGCFPGRNFLVNSVLFCISEYLKHLNAEHLKISLVIDLVTDVFVFGAMEQLQWEQRGAGSNRFGFVHLTCEMQGTLPCSRLFQGHFVCYLAGNMKGLISPFVSGVKTYLNVPALHSPTTSL